MEKIEGKEEQEKILKAELVEALRSLEEIVKAEMPKNWEREQSKKAIKRKGKK